MQKKNVRLLVTVSLVVVSLLFVGSLQAASQDPAKIKYPEKPITLLVGFAPGGPSDVSARIIAPFLEKELGQPVVIQNKPGSAGELSYSLTVSSDPDGYTLCTVAFPNIIAMPLNHKTSFKMEDFAWIGVTSYDENVIAVKAGGKYKTLDDLIKAAKSKPGAITLGDSGPMGDDQLAGMAFANAAGIKFSMTPFKGTGPSVVALLGGHIDAIACNAVDTIEQVKSGKMIVLATMGDKPNAELPGVPTLKSLGYDVIMATYRCISASAKIPPEIIAKLRAALKKACERPDAIQAAQKAKLPIIYIAPEKLDHVVKDIHQKLVPMNLDKIK